MNPTIKNTIFAIERYRLKQNPFVIISNNCWGYEIYNALQRPYNTPFVGLFLYPDCYLKLLGNFVSITQANISFSNVSKYLPGEPSYPIGLLPGEIEIHFLHYSSRDEAASKWNRRTGRLRDALVSGAPVFVKICDRDGCTNDHLRRFHSLPFKNKLSIGIKKFDSKNHLCVPEFKDPLESSVTSGLKLYQFRYHYFDISHWLSSGIVRHSVLSRILSFLSRS